MEISSPQVSKQKGPSLVWIIPLVTLLVGGWLIFKTLSERGPRATISFKTAEGIEVGKTKVKYKNIDIGVVEEVRFSDDLSNTILTVEFNKGSEKFLRRSTRFWVVKPQLSLRGASGLGTLISGAYIEIEPGQGKPQFHFVGLEQQPVVKSEEQGKKITLVTQKLGSVDTGSPVYYQGLQAGEVLGYELANDRKSTYVYAFIKDPFDQLIRGNTNFWNVSGINVSMDADGFKVQTESLSSIMFGGIAFETPETLEQATTDVDNLIFTLHENYESIKKHAYTRKIKFIMFFDSSIRGLSLGAPVEFKGIKVGSVLDARIEFDRKKNAFRIPVLIEIEPQRIIERGSMETGESSLTLDSLVELGLRARLQTGSLLTSQLFIELDMHPGSPINLSGTNTPYPELPTLPTSSFGAITQSVEELLAKLNAVDIKEVTDVLVDTIETANSTMHSADEAMKSANSVISSPGIPEAIEDLRVSLNNLKSVTQKLDDSNIIAGADSAIANVNTLLESPDVKASIKELHGALKNFNSISKQINDTGLVATTNKALVTADKTLANADRILKSPDIPNAIKDLRAALKNVRSVTQKVDDAKIQEAIDAGHQALDNLSKTLDKANKVLDPNSPLQYSMIQLSRELEETSRAIRSLIETLERNPQELIFGKDQKARGK